MRVANDFLKKLQEQFELANRPSGFPPKLFQAFYRWQPQPGERSLRKLAHYKQGFPPLEPNKAKSEVQIRNCWNVLTNALLLEGYGNNDYSSADLEHPAGDLFHLANNPSLFPPWHGAILSAYHLNISLLVLLILYKGDLLASQTGQLEAFYFETEPIRGESTESREIFDALRAGTAFSSNQLRAIDPFLEGALGMPNASERFKAIIQVHQQKAEGMREQWATDDEMNASITGNTQEFPSEVLAMESSSSGAGSSASGGEVVIGAAPAKAPVRTDIALPQPKDPFLRMFVPTFAWIDIVRALEAGQFSKAAELLREETQRETNPSRLQFLAYLLLARCWLDLGEQTFLRPTLRLLWREVKKYGYRDADGDLAEELLLFRWEPALLGELCRLTLLYTAKKEDDECEEITGYQPSQVEQFALSAGLSFLSPS